MWNNPQSLDAVASGGWLVKRNGMEPIHRSNVVARLGNPVRITEQMWPEGSVPVVSVFNWAYNHAAFIRASIESILMQETTFRVEIIIHDDASTDGTTEIIREYEAKYPQLFRNIIQIENQWSQGKSVMTPMFEAPRGDFVALTHGDDEWSDHRKLQNQVEYLQSKPDAVLSCHRVRCQREGESSAAKDYRVGTDVYPDLVEAHDIPWAVLMRRNPVQTCSVVYRRSALPQIPAWFHGLAMGDWPLCLELSTKGVIHYSPEVMATYRVHDTSYWSSAKKEWILDKTHEMLRRAFSHTVGDGHGVSGRELYQLIEPVLDKSFIKRMAQTAALVWAGFRNLKGSTRWEFLQALGQRTRERIAQVRGAAKPQ
jgi:glycosyltransferase involved in cell wall biosynthesis